MPANAFPIGSENYMRTARPLYSKFGGVIPGRGSSSLATRGSSPAMSFREAYPASVGQTGEDYSGIMKGYQDILGEPEDRRTSSLFSGYQDLLARPQTSSGYEPESFQYEESPDVMEADRRLQELYSQDRMTPEKYQYTRSPELGKALGTLGELSDTGGYSPEALSNIRVRGVSPIRSVYANAQRNLDRQRALSGGYSPNYGAVSARMARDLSEQLSGATTNIEADIAERVASGRRSMAPQFAQAAAGESAAANEASKINTEAQNRANELQLQKQMSVAPLLAKLASDRSELANKYRASNVDAINRSREFNARNQLESDKLGRETQLSALGGMRDTLSQPDKRFEALKGMTSLYGTTPALANTFGNQALQAAELQERAKDSSRRAGTALVSQLPQKSIAPRPVSSMPVRNTPAPPLRIGFRGRRFGGG